MAIPIEIQCPRDPERVCPLLETQSKLEELHDEPIEDRGTINEFNARISEIGQGLSRFDRSRFYAMQGNTVGRGELKMDSCANGPEKSMVIFGKMSCGAQVIFEPYVSAV